MMILIRFLVKSSGKYDKSLCGTEYEGDQVSAPAACAKFQELDYAPMAAVVSKVGILDSGW